MSALGHVLEAEGIPTVSVSLIREHTAAMRPPRALWVPFELGRPMGAPNDSGFQRRVLLALLGLLDRTDGPVLEDFPDDAPGAGDTSSTWVCPVSFARPARASAGLRDRVMAEVRGLEPWHAVGTARRGRTSFGVSGMAIEPIVELLAGYAEHGHAPGEDFATRLKYALDDLLAYYHEAAAAKPGARPSSAELRDWFWGETAAAELFRDLRRRGGTSDDKRVRHVVTALLVPRGVVA